MIGRFLNRWLAGWRGGALAGLVVVILLVVPMFVGQNAYLTQLLLTFFIFAIFGHGWNLLAGYCGLLSFGNQVYVGISGFALAILVYYGGVDVWLALPIAALVAAAFAYLLAVPVRETLSGPHVLKPAAVALAIWILYEIVVAYDARWDVIGDAYVRRVMLLLLIFLGALPLLRLQGAYFAVATWLVAASVATIFNEWKVVGAGGGMRIASDATLEQMYYAGLVLLCFATWVVWRLLRSRYGLALTAVRDDEQAAQTVGVDVRKVKLVAFVISGGLTGLAAGLFYIDAVSITPPAAFNIFWSAYFVFIVVAGGMGTLAGPIVGAAIFVVIDRVISGWVDQPLLILGLAAILLILFLPRGVLGVVNALRHTDDFGDAWREIVETTAVSGLLQRYRKARGKRGGGGVVAAFLVPGSPLPLLRPETAPWKPIVEGYRAASALLATAKPDVVLLYSTQWLAVLDQLWQTRPRVRGIHVDENWYDFGDLPYDIEIDAELAMACVAATKEIGVKSRSVNYDGFPIDTGTIVAATLLDPDGRRPFVIASNNLYHDWDTTHRLGALAVEQALDQGKRVALVGVGALSANVFRSEIDPEADDFAGDIDDATNRRILELLIAGESDDVATTIPRIATEFQADMGLKHLAWLLGGMGETFRGAIVHSYGPTWGTGAAVVEFALSERAARRGRKRGIPHARTRIAAPPQPVIHRPPDPAPPSTPAPAPSAAVREPDAPRSVGSTGAVLSGSEYLYRSFRTQAEIDAQYDVENSVEDFGVYVDFFLSNSERVRKTLKPELDLSYGPTSAEHIDLFRASAAGAPLHMFIHGGYWHSLSSKEFSLVAEGLVAAGVSVAVVNYELCPKVTISEIVRQNRAAIAWLYRNAARFGADPDRITVSGHSAGGHLTAMLMATDWSGEYGLPDDVVKAGCSISGLFDLEPFQHSWLQPKLRLTKEEIERSSPIHHIPGRAGPLIVTLGGDESAEFHRQSEEFLAAWTAGGLRGSYLDLPGQNHFTVLEGYQDRNAPLCSAILRQIRETDR